MFECLREFRCLNLQHSPIIPIEKIRLSLKRRDELPLILVGLQWIWMHPTLKADIFTLLETKNIICLTHKITDRSARLITPLFFGCDHIAPLDTGATTNTVNQAFRLLSLPQGRPK